MPRERAVTRGLDRRRRYSYPLVSTLLMTKWWSSALNQVADVPMLTMYSPLKVSNGALAVNTWLEVPRKARSGLPLPVRGGWATPGRALNPRKWEELGAAGSTKDYLIIKSKKSPQGAHPPNPTQRQDDFVNFLGLYSACVFCVFLCQHDT